MTPIVISQGDKIIAHHTTSSPMSSYGQPVWIIEEANPSGYVTWRQGDNRVELEVVEVRDGWLICIQPTGEYCGIIWSDGSYYANLLVDRDDMPCIDRSGNYDGLHILGTVVLPGSPMGAIIC